MPYPGTDNKQLPFDESLLRHLVPIRELQPDDRRHLAVKSHVIDLLPGYREGIYGLAVDHHKPGAAPPGGGRRGSRAS